MVSIGPVVRMVSAVTRRYRRRLATLATNRRGNIAIMMAFFLPIMIGAFGTGVEITYWYQQQRAMQNAADAAAVAAATNGGANYATEAQAVAALAGFTNGSGGVSVTASNTAACPGGGTNCYSVIVTGSTPILFAQLVGFTGNGRNQVNLTATAVASQGTVPDPYCLLALAGSGTNPAITCHGCPNANLSGCSIMSNTGATCTGHNLNAVYGDAHGVSSGCGNTPRSNQPTVSDPYAYLATSIPANTCSSYPQEGGKHDPPLPVSNQLSGTLNLAGGTTVLCGDQQLQGDYTVTGGGTIVIDNGQLDTNGYQFNATSGVTVIFSGTAGSYTHAPTGGGGINITAPTSGTWKGIAIYQDPALSSGVDISAAGNSPAWNVTGAVYLPHASVTISGAVGASGGCMIIVTDNILINGTGNILSTESACAQAGVRPPAGTVPGRGTLVK